VAQEDSLPELQLRRQIQIEKHRLLGLDYLVHHAFNLFPALAFVPNYGFAIPILSFQTFKTDLPQMWLGVSNSVTLMKKPILETRGLITDVLYFIVL
jgi:hypothetical protein